MKNILILFSLIILFSACEEKAVVIPPFEAPTTGKVVLVEELTGVSCPNCPTGSERISVMLGLFPDNMIAVGIHGGILTEPLSESKHDFRTEAGEFLDNYLKDYAGKPSAYFNRVKYPEWEAQEIWGNPAPGLWQGYVEDELEKPQVIELTITKSYDPETRLLDVAVTALPFEDLDGEFKLTIMLTESGIIDAQDDQDEVIKDYVHNHVLRDIITNYEGDFFADGLENNKAITKDYSYTIPVDDNGLWNDDHIEIVAFIANTEGDSEEVLQAAESHLKD